MKHFFKKRKGLIFSILILIVFFMSFSTVISAGFLWFGGNITTVVPCTCSTGSQVTIANTGHNAMFNGTYLYLPTSLRITGRGIPGGTIILGKKSSDEGVCDVGAEPYCESIPITRGTIEWFGTD